MTDTKKVAKVANNYCYEKCELLTCNKKYFEKYLQTKKHNDTKNHCVPFDLREGLTNSIN